MPPRRAAGQAVVDVGINAAALRLLGIDNIRVLDRWTRVAEGVGVVPE